MSSSDNNSDMDVTEEKDDEDWKKVKKKSKKRKTTSYSPDTVNKIIIGEASKACQSTKTPVINSGVKNLSHKEITPTQKVTHKNRTSTIKGISHKKYKHMYYLKAEANLTRIQFTDIWANLFPNANDEIIKTKMGFILKTNTPENNVLPALEKLISLNKIESIKETTANTTPTTSAPEATFSVVIATVEQEIDEGKISEELRNKNLIHRYCKRIISASTNKPTNLIRIITSSQKTSEILLKEGFYFKYRHYPVYPSKPPAPTPKPCSKCLAFTHPTEECNATIKCPKCFGNHSLNKCTSTLPPKCVSCSSEDHQAWSYKCPNRPKTSIQGVPNIKIKSLNKKSHEIQSNKKKSRIHAPITIHDTIINTYLNEINNDTNTHREELIQKLRQRFINNFNVDTFAIFSGNRVYILIIDLEEENPETATEPINESNNVQYVGHVSH